MAASFLTEKGWGCSESQGHPGTPSVVAFCVPQTCRQPGGFREGNGINPTKSSSLHQCRMGAEHGCGGG